MHIRVASYNIHKGVGTDRLRRPERILEVLVELDADVIALQEVDRRFGLRASVLTVDAISRHTPYLPVPVAVRPASLGWHGNALLVRRGAGVLGRQRIDLPTLEPRGAVMAEVEVRGQRLRVAGMHLDLSGIRRARQARAVIDAAARGVAMPTVLMGDLNEWSVHGGCLRDFGAGYRFAPIGPSFHSRRPVARLDRIMVGPELRVIDCGVHRSACAGGASDHLPVWAELELPRAPIGV